jgi:pimeloyl-ACP methyl ester carboxylesterase
MRTLPISMVVGRAVALIVLGIALLTALPARAASVDGLEIHTSVRGEGPAVIFVHGWTCNESSWDAQVEAFARDYKVVTLDLPGHGKTPAPRDGVYSMDLFSRAVEAVRQELGEERIVLVGHSMGAVVIRQYALDHPGHVAGLVAVDGLLDVRPFAATRFPPMTPESRAAVIEDMFAPETSEGLRQEIRAMMLSPSHETAMAVSNTIVDPAIQSDRVIGAPALTVWAGNRDASAFKGTVELLPQWESVQLDGTGHFLMMERPEVFHALLRTFLQERALF